MTLNLKPLFVGFFVIVVLMSMAAVGGTLSLGNTLSPLTQAQADQLTAQTVELVRGLQIDNDHKTALNAEALARQQAITESATALLMVGTWIGYTLQVTGGIALNTIFITTALSCFVLLAWLIIRVYRYSRQAIVTPIDTGLKEINSNAHGMVIYTHTGRSHRTNEPAPADEALLHLGETRLLAEIMGQVAREHNSQTNALELFRAVLERLPHLTRRAVEPGFWQEVRRREK